MLMIAIALVALTGSSALGGVISFMPHEITVEPGTIFTLDLVIESTELGFSLESFEVDIRADDLTLTGFEFAEFTRFFELNQVEANLVQIGWFGPPFTLPFAFGTLTIDTTAIAPGDYTITADGLNGPLDGLEQFEGLAVVHIVPEPSTILLLLLGAGMAGMAKQRSGSARQNLNRGVECE